MFLIRATSICLLPGLISPRQKLRGDLASTPPPPHTPLPPRTTNIGVQYFTCSRPCWSSRASSRLTPRKHSTHATTWEPSPMSSSHPISPLSIHRRCGTYQIRDIMGLGCAHTNRCGFWETIPGPFNKWALARHVFKQHRPVTDDGSFQRHTAIFRLFPRWEFQRSARLGKTTQNTSV